jgi:hypothetical protein
MPVNILWAGSPNYSPGGLNQLVMAHHTTEGAETAESLRNFISQASAKVSYHFAVDMAHGDNWAMQYVRDSDRAWAQASYNGVAVSIVYCTPSGASSGWSRATWMSKTPMLTSAGRLTGEICKRFNIPLVQLTNSQAQNYSSKGLCEHKNFGVNGGNHHDCGPGFPMDEIIRIARGGSAPTPPKPPGPNWANLAGAREDDYMSSIAENPTPARPRDVAQLRLFADVGGQGATSIKVRVALHHTKDAGFDVSTVDLTPANARRDVVLGDTDGASLSVTNGNFKVGYCWI